MVAINVYTGHDDKPSKSFELSKTQKLRFMAFEKSLQSTITELEQWYTYFDPSWLMISLNPNPGLDQRLSQVAQAEDTVVLTLRNIREAMHERPSSSNRLARVVLAEGFLQDKENRIEHSPCWLGRTADDSRIVVCNTLCRLRVPGADTSPDCREHQLSGRHKHEVSIQQSVRPCEDLVAM